MRKKLLITTLAFVLVLSFSLLYTDSNWHNEMPGNSNVVLAASKGSGAASLYNTYWFLDSYTGNNFYVVFYSNGKYLMEGVRGDRRDSGTWSYSNGSLKLDGQTYTKKTDGGETYYEMENNGWYNILYSVPGAAGFDMIKVKIDWHGLDLYDEITFTDTKPYVDSKNRIMVPLRPIAEAMRLEVAWDQNTKTATFTGSTLYNDGRPQDWDRDKETYQKYAPASWGSYENYLQTSGYLFGPWLMGDTVATFKANNKAYNVTYKSSDMDINGNKTVKKTLQMDTSLTVRNGHVYAPVRYLAETFGYTIKWSGDVKTLELQRNHISNPFK